MGVASRFKVNYAGIISNGQQGETHLVWTLPISFASHSLAPSLNEFSIMLILYIMAH